MTFFVNVIKAVHSYAPLLRASIASIGNDHRLGANEAPPAIISIFIGSTLTKALESLMANSNSEIKKGDNPYIKLGVSQIPSIFRDSTDRNRTSPFAFTGNKFEFRAVGSTANNAVPMCTLNTIVAQQLQNFKNDLEVKIKSRGKKEVHVIEILKGYLEDAKNVLFEGDGYSEEWVKEAAKRGLPNIKSTPKALDAYLTDSSLNLFGRNNVMSKSEIEARHEIMLENYILKMQIESRIMGDLALNHIIPAAIEYQNKLLTNLKDCKSVDIEPSPEVKKLLERISKHITAIHKSVSQMINARKAINKIENIRGKAIEYHGIKERYFDTIRDNVDKLEFIIEDSLWPLPKYRELLFVR